MNGLQANAELSDLGIIGIIEALGLLAVFKFVSDHRMQFIIGGATLMGIGEMPRFKDTIASKFLVGIGGIGLGLGVVPFLTEAVG